METLQRCRRCGFEFSLDDRHDCRRPARHRPEDRRAARQVAGIDLPTRSVLPLPHADSRQDRRPGPSDRRPSWASDLVAYTTMLMLASMVALGLSFAARMERFAVVLPNESADVLGHAATGLAVATVITGGLAMLALLAHAVVRWLHRADRPPAHLRAR